LGHTVCYQKQWRRLKERVINVISALQNSCLEAQEKAKQKLEDCLNGMEASSDETEVLGTWVKNPLTIRGREPEDFLPKFIHPKDLDLKFLSKVNLSEVAPDLALVQKNLVLEERNKEAQDRDGSETSSNTGDSEADFGKPKQAKPLVAHLKLV
jgi:hypothetical protein